jgi:hypothetical protein
LWKTWKIVKESGQDVALSAETRNKHQEQKLTFPYQPQAWPTNRQNTRATSWKQETVANR